MVTIEEIAKKAGVTKRTALRALAGDTQGKRRDAKERADRVIKIANELGYHPSNIAQALKSGKTKTVGIVTGGLSNPYFGVLVESFLDELEKHNLKALLSVTKWDLEKERECLKDLLRYRVDAIIYLGDLSHAGNRECQMLKKNNYPLYTFSQNSYGLPSVVADYDVAIEDAVKYAKKRGVSDIAFATPQGRPLQNESKISTFKRCCEKHKLKSAVYKYDHQKDKADMFGAPHEAWIINGVNTVSEAVKIFSEEHVNMKSLLMGFYDKYSWNSHLERIDGAIISPMPKIVQEIVDRISGHISGTYDECQSSLIPSAFCPQEEFSCIDQYF